MTRTTTVVAMVTAMGFCFVAQTSHAAKACDKTSKAARSACKSAAKDDYWIAVGNCNNLSSEAARKACLSAAKASLKEAGPECKDQLEARAELCDALGQDPYDPVIDPSNFRTPAETAAMPNPYLPLVPGTVRTYEGPGETITVTVTNQTKVILGVTTIVVHDVVVDDMDVPIEDTEDWFAQDLAGNVWYFGELSKSFENGELESLGRLVDGRSRWRQARDRHEGEPHGRRRLPAGVRARQRRGCRRGDQHDRHRERAGSELHRRLSRDP